MGTAQWDVERRVSEIRTGTPYEEIDVENRSFFSFDDEVIALKKEDEELHFQCFDPDGLKEKARSMTELEDNKMVHEGTVKIGGELYFLYAWWDGDKEEERLFSRKLDRSSCELGPAKKIFSYSDHRMEGEQVNAGFLSVKTIDKFDFYTSLKEDEDAEGKLMARFRIEPDEVDNEDEEKYMIGLLVFNEDMELQWKGVHLMPYHEERMDELDYSVNDEGEVYMLAEVSEGEDPDERDAPCHYEVFKFSDGKANFEHANIDLGEKIESSPGRIVLQGAPDGGVIFAGFYSAKEGRPAKGTITSKVDPDGGASKVRMTRFPKDVVAGFEGEGYLDDVEKTGPSNPDVGLNNLNIRHVRVYENGDLLLVGEQ